MKLLIQTVLAFFLVIANAQAAIDTFEFSNDVERSRYRDLVEELRCPKCQNQNIADSDSPIAMDLRAEIYQMLEQGKSDEQIIDFLVMRYGDFVLYDPPVTSRTLLLWYGPGLLLLIGLVSVTVIVRRRRRQGAAETVQLSNDEAERLAPLLSQASQDKKD